MVVENYWRGYGGRGRGCCGDDEGSRPRPRTGSTDLDDERRALELERWENMVVGPFYCPGQMYHGAVALLGDLPLDWLTLSSG